MRWWLLALVACGNGPSVPECKDACPEGTRVANFNNVNVVSGESFVVTEATCETVCETVTPCEAPNVPRVWKEGDAIRYSCAPLPGMNGIPAKDSIDLAFGALWDDTLATPTWDRHSTGARSDQRVGAIDVDADGLLDLVTLQNGLLYVVPTETFYAEDPHWWNSGWDFGDPLPVPNGSVTQLHGVFPIGGVPTVLTSDAPGTVVAWTSDGIGNLAGAGQVANLAPGTVVDVADLDADGALDIAFVELGFLGILYGVGDGTFEPRVNGDGALGAGGEGLAIADFDGDGFVDLVHPGSPVTVWWSTGSRSWAPAEVLSVSDARFATAFGTDLALVHAGNVAIPELFANDGAGGFTSVWTEPLLTVSDRLLATDLDGDGQLDLAGNDAMLDFAAIWLGDGAGLEPMRRVYATQGGLYQSAADLQGDGFPDLITCGGFGSASVSWKVGP